MAGNWQPPPAPPPLPRASAGRLQAKRAPLREPASPFPEKRTPPPPPPRPGGPRQAKEPPRRQEVNEGLLGPFALTRPSHALARRSFPRSTCPGPGLPPALALRSSPVAQALLSLCCSFSLASPPWPAGPRGANRHPPGSSLNRLPPQRLRSGFIPRSKAAAGGGGAVCRAPPPAREAPPPPPRSLLVLLFLPSRSRANHPPPAFLFLLVPPRFLTFAWVGRHWPTRGAAWRRRKGAFSPCKRREGLWDSRPLRSLPWNLEWDHISPL